MLRAQILFMTHFIKQQQQRTKLTEPLFFRSPVGIQQENNHVLTMNSAQTPENEQTQCESDCALFDPVINEVADLHLTGTGTRFTGHVEQDPTLHLSFSTIIGLCATHNSQPFAWICIVDLMGRFLFGVLSCVTCFSALFCIILHTCIFEKQGLLITLRYIILYFSLLDLFLQRRGRGETHLNESGEKSKNIHSDV